MNYNIILILFFLGMYGCSSQDNNNAIYEEVTLKYNNYKRNKINRCVKSALEDAEIYVDSIITEYTKNSVKNIVEFPDKPQKNYDSSLYDIKIDSFDIDLEQIEQ